MLCYTGAVLHSWWTCILHWHTCIHQFPNNLKLNNNKSAVRNDIIWESACSNCISSMLAQYVLPMLSNTRYTHPLFWAGKHAGVAIWWRAVLCLPVSYVCVTHTCFGLSRAKLANFRFHAVLACMILVRCFFLQVFGDFLVFTNRVRISSQVMSCYLVQYVRVDVTGSCWILICSSCVRCGL